MISGNDLPCGEIIGQIKTFSTSKFWYPQNLNLHVLLDSGIDFQNFEKRFFRETYKDPENINNLLNYNQA